MRFEIRQNARFFHFTMDIEAQVLSERIWSLNMARHCRKDHVPELDAVIRQTVHEVEVEIA